MFYGKMAVKLVQTIVVLVVAAFLVYRGNTYNDPNGMSMMPVVMCGLLATFLALVGVTLMLESRDGAEAH